MRRAAGLLLLLALSACGLWTEHQLTGRWETLETPKRTLDLRKDHTFTQRLSGKTLGFVSDLLGPQKGTWAVDGEALVLTVTDDKGVEQATRLPIKELTDGGVILGDERWARQPTE